jgi:spermidine/putrescine transport system substrate-binding protein
MVSNSGIGYLASKVEAKKASTWQIFGDSAYKGRMTMLNDMREAMGAALKSLGYSLNSTNRAELEKARDVLIGWKKNLAKFEADQYKNGLASEEFTVVHGYNGDLMQVMSDNDDIRYVIPVEGAVMAADCMVILKSGKEKGLAHDFINFMLRPEVAAANIEYVWFLAPNVPAYDLVSDEIKAEKSIFMPADLLAKCEPVKDLGEFNAVYSEMWDAVKAAE